MAKQQKKKQWTMPTWMEPYRELINTGGNPVEDLMNDDTSPLINLPRSTLAACVKSQVGLLEILHKRRMLAFAQKMILYRREKFKI